MSDIAAWFFVLLQRVLPKHLLTAVVYRIARIRTGPVKNFLIRQFVTLYNVDVKEIAATVPGGFATFNDFFTRALKDDARPVTADNKAVISPVDGTVSAAGVIEKDTLFQAKGHRYRIADLLATDLQDVAAFEGGSFATIYLAPYNYHRVHAPLSGRLRAARYVPGQLFSVNRSTVSAIPDLFAQNERLICHFETDGGPCIVIFVGALNVGSISTPWTGEIRPKKHGLVVDCALDDSVSSRNVKQGDLLGWFNMGSTVIVLLPRGRCQWSAQLVTGQALRMGQSIGSLGPVNTMRVIPVEPQNAPLA